MLVGRDEERALVQRLLDDARAGTPGALLVVGEPGVGKSALLADAADRADGMRAVRVAAVESERALPGSALSLLVSRLLDAVAALDPEAAARLTATMRGVVDRRLAGDVLSLLAEAAGPCPVLVLADDLQWWDPDSLACVLFALRRLADDGVALLAAGRPEAADLPGASALPRLVLRGLDEQGSIDLLGAVAPGTVVEVARALARALDGNPLALLESSQLLSDRARRASEPLPDPLPVGSAVAQRWGGVVTGLPERTRLGVGVLAADCTQSGDVVEAALAAAAIAATDLLEAEAQGVVVHGSEGWTFPHPLVRAAAYAALTPPERRAVHAALAEALRRGTRLAQRAEHLAASLVGPDAEAAGELDSIAALLRDEGSATAAAVAAAHAARATPPGPLRTARLLAAAQLALQATDEQRAAELAEAGLALAPDPVTTARFRRVLGVAAGHDRDTLRGMSLLEAAAAELPGDERSAALVDYLALAKMRGDSGRCLEVVGEMGPLDRLAPWMRLDVGAALATAGDWGRAVPLLDSGLDEVDPSAPGVPETVADAWADAAGIRGLDRRPDRYRAVALALRGSGSPVSTESGLGMLVELAHAEGRWEDATDDNEECRALSLALGREPLFAYGTDLRLAARRGDRARFDAVAGVLRRAASEAGLDLLLHNGAGLRAILLVGLGEVDAAEPLLRSTLEHAPPGLPPTTVFPSTAATLVELLVRSDRRGEAECLVDDLAPRLSGQPSSLGRSYAARLRALVADGASAEAAWREAVALADGGMHAFEAARTRLLLGELLRRRRRRAEAVDAILPALTAFRQMGCAPWAQRCADELHAAGVDVHRSGPYDAPTLTAQERRVVDEVVHGASNAEAARRLYLSPKTVELHLTHVYRKLGISGRAELTRLMGGRA